MSASFPGFDRITVDPDILIGKPTVRGTRLAVERVLDVLAQNSSWDDLRADHPGLEPEDIRQVLRFAAACLPDRVLPFDSSAT